MHDMNRDTNLESEPEVRRKTIVLYGTMQSG